ncbi:hypothetical protein MLP_51840 [Microlunatus phosphovorus NM-1]|uniref:Uncharacterized protein n=1 Tax=Microlunatus phosphovorus (strain ATCC 700054 / DSM 10555 / JCM 9379 / NBRC 101784 / NCIMB 13414 / VKM Ac-1990 / NM-1) TaxID=1032480 RepID=F5XIG0_MICPN|nr:hypothetical protein [Microlunatus phosphovorus]BAK38198.1 hypothetical protein MLP_51840 [Microlunatus phosphovorus NM-1]
MTAPEQLPALGSEQLTALVHGLRRSTDGGRPPRAWARWRSWAVEAQADADRLKALAVLAMSIERSTRTTLDNTPRVLRDLPAWLSATITVLLMCAGLFTLHAILAVADVPPLESWLLPAAFGPVFVMSIKTYVGWWLGQVDNERRARRLLARVLVPAQLLAFAAAVGGIAIKSMIIGTLTPLGETSSMVSSAMMFGAVVLMEGAGAVALAARQHRPGAREFEWANGEHRRARRRARRAVDRALQAEMIARREAAWMAGRQEWAAGRVTAGLVRGWHRAVQDAADGDPILDRVAVDDLRVPVVPAVAARSALASDSDQQPSVERSVGQSVATSDSVDDIDAEFRRMLAGRDNHQGQDPLW